MKKLLLVLPLLLLFSCSIQKRKYQNGYYVDWHNKATKKENKPVLVKKQSPAQKTVAISSVPSTPVPASETRELSASSDEGLGALDFKKKSILPAPGDTCDVLVYKDGSEIKGKVLEIGATEIKYKRCDTPDGPTYISRKSELFMVKYANGSREVIKSETPPQQVQPPTRTYNTPPSTYKQQQQTYGRMVHPLAVVSLIAGILAIVIAYIALIALLIGIFSTASIFILPFLAALVAAVSGKTAQNRIKLQPDLYKGRNMAKTGFIMGMIILAIYVTITLLVLLILSTI